MSKVVRSVKNVTKGYSSVQVKVRNGMNRFHYIEVPGDHRVALAYVLAYVELLLPRLVAPVFSRGGCLLHCAHAPRTHSDQVADLLSQPLVMTPGALRALTCQRLPP